MKALENVTVLDFTQAYSGAYCTATMADHGANVIKIERLDLGDQTREWAPLRDDGTSGYYALYNRNKNGIAVDLRSEEGKEIIKRLARKADIVTNNFKVGTLDRLGLGYEDLKKENPNILFTSITGYGQSGPMAKNAAYDNVIEATCGLMEQSGFADKQPIRSGCSVGDSYTGLMACLSTMAAYYHQLCNGGEGQTIDLAMQDCLLASIEDTLLEYYGNGVMMPREGNTKTHTVSPYDVCECKDGWVAYSAYTDRGFAEFCEDAGLSELITDERFKDNDSRCANNDALSEIMYGVFKELSFDDIEKKFTNKHFAVCPVMDAEQAINHPHINERGMVQKVNDHNVGEYTSVGVPVKLSETPGSIEKGSSLLGEYTVPVLKDLGYSEEEIKKLEEDGIIQFPKN